jgi:hypothetical protein
MVDWLVEPGRSYPGHRLPPSPTHPHHPAHTHLNAIQASVVNPPALPPVATRRAGSTSPALARCSAAAQQSATSTMPQLPRRRLRYSRP